MGIVAGAGRRLGNAHSPQHVDRALADRGGAVLTESIFNIQGVGYLAVQAAFNNDLPTIIGVTLLAAIAIAFANLLVDILYAFLDPRIRYV